MSWSASGSNLTRDAIADIQPGSPVSGEPADQLEQAKQLAAAIVDSGVVGDADGHRFNLSLSGHANPGARAAGRLRQRHGHGSASRRPPRRPAE